MSNRFHSKYHRQNHHTYTNFYNPDAGHDPIASKDQPFRGDFVLNGALSCIAPLSSTAGYFYSNNIALCAVSQYRGLHVVSIKKANDLGTNTGIYVYSTGVALSSVSTKTGADIYSLDTGINVYGSNDAIISYSPNRGITSFGAVYAGNFQSSFRAISAYGNYYGINATSPNYGITVFGGKYGGSFDSFQTAITASGLKYAVDVYSQEVAINAVSDEVGIKVNANTYALSSGGAGVNVFNNRIGIFKTPQTSYDKADKIVLDVNGNTYINGNLTLTGDISANGIFTYFDTKVTVTSSLRVLNKGSDTAVTISQTGGQPILACYDADVSETVPSFIVHGDKNGWVGLGVATPLSPLHIVKSKEDSSNQPQIVITNDKDEHNLKTLALGTDSDLHELNNPFIGTFTPNHLLFATNSSTRMFLTSTGKLGMGISYHDSLTSSLIDVNGAITLRMQDLNLSNGSSPSNTDQTYIHLPYNNNSYATLRQMETNVQHLTLDLGFNPTAINPSRFSIRNIEYPANTIKNRFYVGENGKIAFNVSDNVINSELNNDTLTVNNNISGSGDFYINNDATIKHGDLTVAEGNLAVSEGNLTVTQGNLTVTQGDLTVTQGNITIPQAQTGENNVLTRNIADTRYSILSTAYLVGVASNINPLNNIDWTDVGQKNQIQLDLSQGKYIIDGFINFQSKTANGYNIQSVFSGGTVNEIRIVYSFDTTSGTDLAGPYLNSIKRVQNTMPNTIHSTTTVVNSYITMEFKGIIDVSTSGRLKFQMASSNVSNTSIDILENSYISAVKFNDLPI